MKKSKLWRELLRGVGARTGVVESRQSSPLTVPNIEEDIVHSEEICDGSPPLMSIWLDCVDVGVCDLWCRDGVRPTLKGQGEPWSGAAQIAAPDARYALMSRDLVAFLRLLPGRYREETTITLELSASDWDSYRRSFGPLASKFARVRYMIWTGREGARDPFDKPTKIWCQPA